MFVLAGGAALKESVTVDEVAHIGAGLSYLQKFDLRLNEEHPPLPKMLAALPLVIRGTHADYTNPAWPASESFFPAYMGQWVFGERVITTWNDPASTLAWARLPMLLLTLVMGWVVYRYASDLGGPWAGLLSLTVFVTSPVFLTFGPLVLTDIPVALFSLLALWTFTALWQEPSRRNVWLFAAALAGAILSKFTGLILFPALLICGLSTRWWPVAGQPASGPERKQWRRIRWRAATRGVLIALAAAYVFYFMFSWNQSTDVLNRIGSGPASTPLRRILMPPWLYLRGLLLVAAGASRPTMILGHAYPHGVWFYFPTVLAFKSPLGLLGLIGLAAAVGIVTRRRQTGSPAAIPEALRPHWRFLWISFLVFTGVCLLSRLNLGLRHFTVPLSLMILMLAPLPRLLPRLPARAARAAGSFAILCTAGCLYSAVAAYPYYFPYVNPLGFGRPAYRLVNDSNIDWNQALPAVHQFAREHRLASIGLDWYGFTNPRTYVPEARPWDCQAPAPDDAGNWVVVSANIILDSHNCEWLTHYPNEALAGGSMYAVRLPEKIPAAGAVGGPPLPSARRLLFGAPFDLRGMYPEFYEHPDRIAKAIAEMQAKYQAEVEAAKKPKQ